MRGRLIGLQRLGNKGISSGGASLIPICLPPAPLFLWLLFGAALGDGEQERRGLPSVSPSSCPLFLPLPSTPQQLPPGKGSGAEGSAAASAGCFENLFNWAAEAAARLQRFPLHFCRSSNLKSQDSLFSQPPCPSLTSFPSGPRLPGPKPSLPL